MPSNWILPKWSGSYADTLAAVGLAVLIESLGGEGDRVKIQERGDAFLITGPPLNYEQLDVQQIQTHPLFHYVLLKENDPDCPSHYYDYLKQRRLQELAKERSKKSKKAKALLVENVEEDAEQVEAPDPQFAYFQRINMLQGFGARNKLYLDFSKADIEALRETLVSRLTLFESGQSRPSAKTPFQPTVSALQVFNPVVGKGINRPKADGTMRGSLSGAYVDWFEEWLRFIGSDHMLYGFKIGDDIKMSVPVPAEISLEKLFVLKGEKLTAAWHSRKVDLFLVMNQVSVLLDKSGFQGENPWIPKGKRPNEVISAVQTAYFKSLGSGKAVTNISSLGLPGWFPVESHDDVELWRDLLEEHRKVLQWLDEDKSEEAALLTVYRDFLCAGNWRAFLDFLGAYGCLVMRRREKERAIRSFSIKHLEGLLMRGEESHLPIVDVIQNAGFKNIAAALKQATVGEQYHKTKRSQVFEIHYGLFQEIKRKAKFPEQLLAVIMGFVNEYNYENARRAEQLHKQEKSGRRRTTVSLDDLNQFCELMQTHRKHSETIAMMLIAYASASSGQKSDDSDIQEA